MLRDLIEVFANDSERLMAEVRDAIETGAASKLGRAAHTIKSMVQFFSATEAADAARRLEMMGNDGHLEGAAEQYRTSRRGTGPICGPPCFP